MSGGGLWEDYERTSRAFFSETFSHLKAQLAQDIAQPLLSSASAASLLRVDERSSASAVTNGASESEGWLGDDLALRSLAAAPGSEAVLRGLLETIECDARARLSRARQRWQGRTAELKGRLADLEVQKSDFSRRCKGVLDVVHLREAMYGKRLEYQARNATRRLQELIYECLGEYDKTHRRAMGRTAFLHSDSENQVRRAVDALQWTRFAQRLTEDMMGMVPAEYVDPRLCPDDFRLYANRASKALEARLPHGMSAVVSNVVKLNPGPGAGRKRGANGGSGSAHCAASGSSCCSPVCADVVAMTGVLWKAAERVDRRMKRVQPQVCFSDGSGDSLALTTRASHAPSSHGAREPAHDTLLSCAAIKWLLAAEDRWTGSRAPEPVNTRVYYCLEERARNGLGNARPLLRQTASRAEALATYLEALFVEKSQLPAAQTLAGLGSTCARTVRLLPVGRRRAGEAVMVEHAVLEAFPHVLEVEVQQPTVASTEGPLRLHLACASVLQLLESVAFAESARAAPPAMQEDLQDYHNISLSSPPILTHLFVALPSPTPPATPNASPSDALLHSTLIPLSPRGLQELIHLYLLRPPPRTISSVEAGTALLTSASAMSIFPPTLPDQQQPDHAHHRLHAGAQLKHRYAVVFNPLSADDDDSVSESSTRGPASSSSLSSLHSARGGRGAAAAVLVEFDEMPRHQANMAMLQRGLAEGPEKEAEEEAAATKKAGKKPAARWDVTIVGPYCRWRGCLEAAGERNVCSFHGEVRKLLDRRSSSSSTTGGKSGGKDKVQSEAARYLLRKPLSLAGDGLIPPGKGMRGGAMEADLRQLLHASSLLEELMSGRLGETVRTFCKRAAMESSDKFQAGQRRKLQAQRQQQGIKAPRKNRRGRQDEGEEGEKEEDAAAADKHGMVEVKWAKWRSWDELKARADELEAEIEAAAKLRKVERAITSELHQLSSLGVYPAAELNTLRSEQEAMLAREVARREGEEDWDDEDDGAARPVAGCKSGRQPGRAGRDGTPHESSDRRREGEAGRAAVGEKEAGERERCSRQRELEFAERKHRLLRQRRMREEDRSGLQETAEVVEALGRESADERAAESSSAGSRSRFMVKPFQQGPPPPVSGFLGGPTRPQPAPLMRPERRVGGGVAYRNPYAQNVVPPPPARTRNTRPFA